MKRYVADTQCILWYLADDRRLPKAARATFRDAQQGTAQILVPSIALVETILLVERRRVPQVALAQLMALTEEPTASICVVPLDMQVVRAVADFGPAMVPELADRIVTATARVLDVPLLTTDASIVASGLVKIVE